MSTAITSNASAPVLISGEDSPVGQGRGVELSQTLHTEAGGAMLGLAVYPTITVEDATETTSINALEIKATYSGNPSLLHYATALSVVDFVAPTNTTEAATVRIDNEPTGASKNYALFIGDGKLRIGGNRGHIFGAGTEDDATQVYFHSSEDALSRRGVYVNPHLAGVTDGNVAVSLLVGGTLTEPPSGEAHGMSLRIDPPVIVPADGKFSELSSLLVSGAPTEGDANYAICSESGHNAFGGTVSIGSLAVPVSGVQLDIAGTVNASGYSAGGATGITKICTTGIVSITIVNGLVTELTCL